MDIRNVATKLYDMCCDMDYMDYEETKEKELNDIENVLYYIKSCAENPYNNDCWRTFYNLLENLDEI